MKQVIKKIVLTFPPSPTIREDLASSVRDLVDHYKLLCEPPNFEKRTLIVSAEPGKPRLEKVFNLIAHCKLIKAGIHIKRVMGYCCPEGTTAVAITLPEQGWNRRDPQLLRSYYQVEGYEAKMYAEERRLVLEARTASLDDLPFRRFIEKGYKMEFIT